jgi:hypothetical protein
MIRRSHAPSWNSEIVFSNGKERRQNGGHPYRDDFGAGCEAAREGYDTNGVSSWARWSISSIRQWGAATVLGLPFNDADGNKGSTPLRPGQSISSGSVTITFVSQDAGGDRIRVMR